MKQLLAWGNEAPYRNDYIKDGAHNELRYKIKKREGEYVSEVKDNYRRPEYSEGVYLFNFLDEDSQERWKRKLYEMAVEGETLEVKQSTYKALFCGEEGKWWEHVVKQVTPAGKPCYKER